MTIVPTRTISTCAALALVGGSLLVAAPAHAAPAPVPGCGAVLTEDARLTRDLTCPTGDGLVLTDGVTLDLRGHTLRGGGDGTALRVPNLGDVAVRNGTVRGWGTGLRTDDAWFEAGGRVVVDRVTFRGNGVALDTSGVLGATGKRHDVARSTFVDNGRGMSGVYGQAHVVRSTFTGNRTGVDVITGGVWLEDSRLRGNGTGVSCDESGCLVERTHVVGGDVGIAVRTFGADVVDSVLADNDVAFDSFAVWGSSSVERTVFRRNGTGVRTSASNLRLVASTFRGNGTGFTDVGGGGEESFVVLLDGNRFERNGDGVVTEQPGTSLKGNTAHRNRGWGIYAPAATDLGGNRATGNGRSPQCVGVVCDGHPRS